MRNIKINIKLEHLKTFLHSLATLTGSMVIVFALTVGLVNAYRFFCDPIGQWLTVDITVSTVEAKTNLLPMREWVLETVKQAGINPVEAEKIIQCESGWNDQATNVNTGGSIDRGLFQINNKYHPSVSNACAFDYRCNTEEAIKIYKASAWNAWACAKLVL